MRLTTASIFTSLLVGTIGMLFLAPAPAAEKSANERAFDEARELADKIKEKTNPGARNAGKGAVTANADSDKLPKVIKLERRTDRGNAIGIKSAMAKNNSLTTTCHSKPFPIKSSMYFHRNNIKNKNIEIKKVAKKGPIKAFIIKRFTFFILK